MGPPLSSAVFAAGTRGDLGAAGALQGRDPAGVIVVRVRIDDELHVLEPKAQLLDVGRDLRRGLRESAIDEHVSLVPT